VVNTPYDPRNPSPEFLCRPKSSHPSHDKLRQTYVLLSMDTSDDKVFFIVDGLCEFPSTYEELQDRARYFYEDHECPTNYIRVNMICHKQDADPHGLFKFEEAIWKVGDAHEEDYFCKVFPQLGVKFDDNPSPY
jgi:hypothetical protein